MRRSGAEVLAQGACEPRAPLSDASDRTALLRGAKLLKASNLAPTQITFRNHICFIRLESTGSSEFIVRVMDSIIVRKRNFLYCYRAARI